MARIRTIKPEFFTSEDIVSLSPMARLLYVALWCEADREGRMLWKPKTFKLRYFPGDSFDIEPVAASLVEAGLIIRYGGKYAAIPKFSQHQHINPRESASVLPDPNAFPPEIDASARVSDASARDSDVQGGREGKGKEGDKDSCASADAERDGLPELPAEQQTRFDRFWAAYPKKRSKGDAVKVWKRLRPGELLLARMLNALEAAKTSADWRSEGGKYIPHPASWINSAGWEDEGISLSPPQQTELPNLPVYQGRAWEEDHHQEAVK